MLNNRRVRAADGVDEQTYVRVLTHERAAVAFPVETRGNMEDAPVGGIS